MDEKILILSVSAASYGVLHTIIGPDHYLPFIVMSKARKWDYYKTAWITFLCGLGHVGSSVVIGMIGVIFGIAFKDLLKIEDVRGGLAAWLLIIFGFCYMVWGVFRSRKNQPHRHYHVHPGGVSHEHLHAHVQEHEHSHKSEKIVSLTPWVLFTIFALGPCEVLIPNLMYPAAENNYLGVVIVAFVFSVATIATMITLVLMLSFGIKKIKLGYLEKYMHVLAGAAVFLSGCAIVFLDW
ncbi:MAG: sulfite exporter TauE/SafE family protein [Acidobacteria bacterium]|nr:sulfite exporter TauE/SafE family protein [Acidobacteriota bacterium]